MLVTGADLAQVRVRLADYPFVRISAVIRPADIRTDVRADIRPADIRRISVFLCADFHTMIVYKMITILHK